MPDSKQTKTLPYPLSASRRAFTMNGPARANENSPPFGGAASAALTLLVLLVRLLVALAGRMQHRLLLARLTLLLRILLIHVLTLTWPAVFPSVATSKMKTCAREPSFRHEDVVPFFVF